MSHRLLFFLKHTFGDIFVSNFKWFYNNKSIIFKGNLEITENQISS